MGPGPPHDASEWATRGSGVPSRPQACAYFGQYAFARLLRDGIGGDEDPAAAAKWMRRAATKGDARAQTALGRMYMNGQGVVRDAAEGMAWYHKAAKQGSVAAHNQLAAEYFSGDSVPADLPRAKVHARAAAEQGDADGQAMLASFLFLEANESAKPDFSETLALARASAEQGNANGEFFYGFYLFAGYGTRKDAERALPMLMSAAKKGHEGAKCLIDSGFATNLYDKEDPSFADYGDMLEALDRANSPECREWGLYARITLDAKIGK